MSTDKDWRLWGEDNPYYGVISDERYVGKALDASTERDFYLSGERDIEAVMRLVTTFHGKQKFAHAVDFGCGAGRLAIPLASYASKVTGIDVSPSIIAIARKKVPEKLKNRINFKLSDSTLRALPKTYDLVHSYIVLQHIHPTRGMKFIDIMINRLQPGGICALHVTYHHDAPRLTRTVVWLRNHVLPIHYALNVMRGRPMTTPRMCMHNYSLPRVFALLESYGMTGMTIRHTDHGGYKGVMIVGKKPR